MRILKERRKDNRLTFLYKGLKGKARIPTDDLIPKTIFQLKFQTGFFYTPYV